VKENICALAAGGAEGGWEDSKNNLLQQSIQHAALHDLLCTL